MSRQIKQSELHSLVGKIVTAQFDVTKEGRDGEDFQEIEGKLLAITNNGLIIKNKSTTRLVPYEDLLDIEEIDKLTVRRLLYRWRRVIKTDEVRQHLIDHHGMRLEIIDVLTPDEAMEMHDKIDHSPLGHGHGEKPVKRRRRSAINGNTVTEAESSEEEEFNLPNFEPYDDDDDDDDDDADEILKQLNVVPLQKAVVAEEEVVVAMVTSTAPSNSPDIEDLLGLDI